MEKIGPIHYQAEKLDKEGMANKKMDKNYLAET